jgi:hypothetical protein
MFVWLKAGLGFLNNLKSTLSMSNQPQFEFLILEPQTNFIWILIFKYNEAFNKSIVVGKACILYKY